MTEAAGQKEFAGFFIAPFVINGELEGVGYWKREMLSQKWLFICGQIITSIKSSETVTLNGKLSHIKIKMTYSDGLALMTVSVHDRPVSSTALLSGRLEDAEMQLMGMFVESLCRTIVVQRNLTKTNPFQEIFTLKERPLAVTVPIPDCSVSDDDHELVRELDLHIAGAFFSRECH